MGKAKSVGIKQLHAPKNQNYGSIVPQWVIAMYQSSFFSSCIAHPEEKKNELDRFCIDCHSSLCFNCLPAHACHKHIKIRRYIYSDVINHQDLCKLFNCSGIKTYLTNKAKVLFLKARNHHHHRQQQPNTARDYRCIICERSLQDNSLYCSIACKKLKILLVDHAKEYLLTPTYCHIKQQFNPKIQEVSALYRERYRKGEYLPGIKRQKLKQSRKRSPTKGPIILIYHKPFV